MGRSDLCVLRYDQITWPGTHNSGSGFNGDLMFPSGGAPAPACFYRNQDMNYTAQLEFGIRWFDIDLCYVTEEEATPSVPAGLWTCHSNAYAGMVEDILKQIDDWMNVETNIINYYDVVSLHFNGDYDRSRSQPIAEALNQLLLEYWPPQSIIPRKKRGAGRVPLSMNNELNFTGEWPAIYRAQGRNERVFVFLHESLQLGNQTWAHDTIPSESPSEVVKDSCDGLIDFTRGACNVCTDLWGVDAIGSLGNCISETAEICNTVTLNVSRACFDLRMEYGKTLNVIEVDFPARAPENLSVVQVADMLNTINFNFFNGPPQLIPQPADCNPGYVPTPSPSPLPRPTTYCEALTQIAQTPLYYLQCSPNDAMPCDRLVCPVDLFGDGLIFSVEMAVEAGVCGEPANFLVSLGPFGGAPLSLVSANTTGLYLLLSFPLVITIDQMTDLESIGVEVSCTQHNCTSLIRNCSFFTVCDIIIIIALD